MYIARQVYKEDTMRWCWCAVNTCTQMRYFPRTQGKSRAESMARSLSLNERLVVPPAIFGSLSDIEYLKKIKEYGVRPLATALGVTPKAIRQRRESIMHDHITIKVNEYLSALAPIPGWETVWPEIKNKLYDKTLPIGAFRKICRTQYDALIACVLSELTDEQNIEAHRASHEFASQAAHMICQGYKRPLKALANSIVAKAIQLEVPRNWLTALTAAKIADILNAAESQSN